MLLNSFAVGMVKENATNIVSKTKIKKNYPHFCMHLAIITSYIDFEKVKNIDLTCIKPRKRRGFYTLSMSNETNQNT